MKNYEIYKENKDLDKIIEEAKEIMEKSEKPSNIGDFVDILNDVMNGYFSERNEDYLKIISKFFEEENCNKGLIKVGDIFLNWAKKNKFNYYKDEIREKYHAYLFHAIEAYKNAGYIEGLMEVGKEAMVSKHVNMHFNNIHNFDIAEEAYERAYEAGYEEGLVDLRNYFLKKLSSINNSRWVDHNCRLHARRYVEGAKRLSKKLGSIDGLINANQLYLSCINKHGGHFCVEDQDPINQLNEKLEVYKDIQETALKEYESKQKFAFEQLGLMDYLNSFFNFFLNRPDEQEYKADK